MRTYPHDSPQAAARVVALAMVCDGHVSKAELDALASRDAPSRLGLQPGQWSDVLRELCEDLLTGAASTWSASCCIDPRALAGALGEVDDPRLRVEVLRQCAAVVEADRHLADNELVLMNAAVEQWGLQHEMLRPAGQNRVLEAT